MARPPLSANAESYAANACQTKQTIRISSAPPSPPWPRSDHEGFVGVFRDLPPEIPVIAESHLRIVDLLEVGVGRGGLGIDLVRGLQTGFHDRLAEGPQQCPIRDETLDRLRIARVVSRLDIEVGIAAGDREQGFISLRQGIPLFRIDEEVQRRAALPPAGIVIIFGDLVEA